jgi:hypothetical protein
MNDSTRLTRSEAERVFDRLLAEAQAAKLEAAVDCCEARQLGEYCECSDVVVCATCGRDIEQDDSTCSRCGDDDFFVEPDRSDPDPGFHNSNHFDITTGGR